MPTTVDPLSIQPQLDAQIAKIKNRIDKAIAAATQKLADNILQEGRQDISEAGKFGARWTQGFTYDLQDSGGVLTLSLQHAVPYFSVFQNGALIQGKPLLWIPLSGSDAVGINARDFPGRLFRVNRKSGGAPLLMSADDKQVRYTGHAQVRIPKKFHTVEIINAQARTFGALYRAELAGI